MPVGRRVVVIGGGNTAIDIAVQTKRLGAENVTMVYRRGPEEMTATDHEQEFAQMNGVKIRHWARPSRSRAHAGALSGVVFEIRKSGRRLAPPGEDFRLGRHGVQGDRPARTPKRSTAPQSRCRDGRIVVDAERRTCLEGSGPAATACRRPGSDGERGRGRQAGGALDRSPPRRDARTSKRGSDGRSQHEFPRHQIAQSVLARLGAADRQGTTSSARSRRAGAAWCGRRSARTRRSSTLRRALWRAPWPRPALIAGFNNIELITDRPLEVNLREIKEVKRDWPDRALIVSLMVPCDEDSWKAILARVEETGCDGVELNFGCPHGMSERGMGSAVGQVPEYVEMVTRWCKQHTRMPVIVKLTPNVTNIRQPARAAKRGGADAVSLINTLNSIIGVDLDQMAPDAGGRRQGHPWRLLRPGGEADRAAHGGRDRPRSATARTCRSPASAASRPGATRPSSSRSAPARCRSAPPRCITASRSSTT